MKHINFINGVDNCGFHDFVTLYTKKEYNESVAAIKKLLSDNGVKIKTANLKELLSRSIGFNSEAHLLSSLPIAFKAMDTVYKFNKALNQTVPQAVVFSMLSYRYGEDSIYLHYQGEDFPGDEGEFIDVVERQAEAKTEGTEYDVIKIRGSIYLYDDHFDMYPKHWAHGYQRASMITELFPSFSRLRKITGLVDESEESLDSHILSAARKRTVSLESVFDKLEDEEAGVLEIDRYEMKDRDFAFIASVLAGRVKNLSLKIVDECFIDQKEHEFEFSGFYSWMEKQKGRGDVVSDFARDMLNDKSFPKSAKSLKEVLNYLKSNSPFHYIDDEVEIAVRTSWIEFVAHEN